MDKIVSEYPQIESMKIFINLYGLYIGQVFLNKYKVMSFLQRSNIKNYDDLDDGYLNDYCSDYDISFEYISNNDTYFIYLKESEEELK